MNSKTYLILVAALIIGIASGYLFCSLEKNQAYELGLTAGRQEIKDKIEEVFPSMPEQEEIFSVWGVIKEIKDNALVVEETIYPMSPIEEPEIRIWQVKVTGATELVQNVQKRQEELLAEEGSEEPMLPYSEVEIQFSVLEIGREITIEAGENIKGKTEFEAKKIVLGSDLLNLPEPLESSEPSESLDLPEP